MTIEKLETNRAIAYSSSLLAPYAVDPGAIASRTDREPKRTTWTIDKARGVARLDQADIQPGGLELPLRPMLGCIGTAPARKEAISTSAPGAFVGTGLETSLDVEFSVALVKRKAIGWPRLETDTHVMVLGSARPLLEAFQHATTELAKWLTADYGLTERGAQLLMGQAAEYEVANVVDPNFTVVAKIRKALLPRPGAAR